MEKPIYQSFNSIPYQVVQKVLQQHFKDYSAEPTEKLIKINGSDQVYKFVVEWQDENQSSFDIFKIVENLPVEKKVETNNVI